ncbi:MAG TPA: hypothetical protein ACQGQF_06650, partial [Xylella fastidiosa subsp. pauca]
MHGVWALQQSLSAITWDSKHPRISPVLSDNAASESTQPVNDDALRTCAMSSRPTLATAKHSVNPQYPSF